MVLIKELIFRTREGRAGCAGGPWGVSFRVSIEGEGGEKGGVREWVCRDVGGSCDNICRFLFLFIIVIYQLLVRLD